MRKPRWRRRLEYCAPEVSSGWYGMARPGRSNGWERSSGAATRPVAGYASCTSRRERPLPAGDPDSGMESAADRHAAGWARRHLQPLHHPAGRRTSRPEADGGSHPRPAEQGQRRTADDRPVLEGDADLGSPARASICPPLRDTFRRVDARSTSAELMAEWTGELRDQQGPCHPY